jgi:hypothetical protein
MRLSPLVGEVYLEKVRKEPTVMGHSEGFHGTRVEIRYGYAVIQVEPRSDRINLLESCRLSLQNPRTHWHGRKSGRHAILASIASSLHDARLSSNWRIPLVGHRCIIDPG